MIHILDLQFKGLPHVIAAFLVETLEGPVLVETGPYSTFPNLVSEVKRVGYNIEDIQHVLLSHIHFDHAGASWALAEKGAKIHLHPFGFNHMLDPSKLVQSATRIYGDEMDTLWGALNPIAEDHLIICDHGEEVIIGDKSFIAWHTPGHARHHIAWQLDDVMFTGDVGGIKIDGGLIVPPCPPPDINLEDWNNSIELIIKSSVDKLYLTHFGLIEDKASHFKKLKYILNDWAEWMKPYALSNKPLDEVTPLFQEYVTSQLSDFGLSGEAIDQYEAANPAWMSVAGLMRYWRKKKGVKG